MASRFVFKLHDLSAKSRYCFPSAVSSKLRQRSLSPTRSISEGSVCDKQKRSYSQHSYLNEIHQSSTSTDYVQSRQKSKSTTEDSENKQEKVQNYEETSEDINNETLAENKVIVKPMYQTGNFVYELESMKSLAEKTEEQNNLYNYLAAMNRNHTARVMPHLQPYNLKPFNSSDSLIFPSFTKRHHKITYPVNSFDEYPKSTTTKKEVKEAQRREYSTIEKENPGFYEINKIAELVPNRTQETVEKVEKEEQQINISDNQIQEEDFFQHSIQLGKQCHNAILETEKPVKTPEENLILDKDNKEANLILYTAETTPKNNVMSYSFQFSRNNSPKLKTRSTVPWPSYSEKIKTNKPAASTKYSLLNCDKNVQGNDKLQIRNLSTRPTQPPPDVVKISLGSVKKIKTKKKLPKLVTNKCPCKDDEPLADMKPLERPKMRYIPEDPDRGCDPRTICDITPRADDGLIIQQKTLPKIQVSDCPCVETVLQDVPLKRLPKNEIPEPKRDMGPCTVEPCPPRADANLKLKAKKLPILKAKDCPCVPQDPLTDIPLIRLKAMPVTEPLKICPKPTCPPRADDNMILKAKKLPTLEAPDCPCIDLVPPELLPPLPRLEKIEVKEPPKICPPPPCSDAVRADDGLKIKSKKLPVLKPKDCPCVPQDPLVSVPLIRPKMTYKPMDKEKICIEPRCADNPRADDGMLIEQKVLPHLVPGECPCIETVIKEGTPLPKLIPRPVVEPVCPKVCVGDECCPPRADASLKIKPKKLPKMKPGNCPCINREELKDMEPLKRLNIKMVDPPRKCRIVEMCDVPRSDDNLRITPKKLPELIASNCPCIDAEPLKDGPPLARLGKITLGDPERIIPKKLCEVTPRSDKDDWTYWRFAGNRKKSTSVNVISKRKYYTNSTDNQMTYSKLSNMFASNLETLDKVTNTVTFQPNSAVFNWRLNYLSTDENLHQLNNGATKYGSKRHQSTGKKSGSCGAKKLKDDTKKRKPSPIKCKASSSKEARPLATFTGDDHLQPKNPIFQPKELINSPLPFRGGISAKKSDECSIQMPIIDCADVDPCAVKNDECKDNLTLWQRIVNYFKARPNCPSPEEFKRMRLKKEAQKAAEKAGLCIYDPKDFEEELSEMISSEVCKNKCKPNPPLSCKPKPSTSCKPKPPPSCKIEPPPSCKIEKKAENKCSLDKTKMDRVKEFCQQQQPDKKKSCGKL